MASETEPNAAATPLALTVSQLTTQIKKSLEPAFSQVWVQGEISNCKPAASGHAYFSLKDSGAMLSVAYFGWGQKRRGFDLKDGLQVRCRGKLTIYAPRGSYQLVLDHIEPLGAGALQLAFEQLKAKLASEGLFDSSRKRTLPPYPNRIVIITSPTGAAIQDMLNILGRRAPHVHVTIIPALVQGEEAPKHLIRGLEVANRHQLGELIVLARGGGSIEDLWAFNDENLARTIAASALPVVSGVGHEIDFTICDFVSDLRAPTPSAAAEIITGYWVEAVGKLQEARRRLMSSMQRELQSRQNMLSHIAARVISPRDKLRDQAQRCDELSLRLQQAFQVQLERRRSLLAQVMGKLDALSPLRVLDRGFSIVRDPLEKGRLIRSIKQIRDGQRLEITFSDGRKQVQAL
ncbi:exodeoxyribonuclease VII large subunit [Bdellovibrionota bacterium FG-2]